MLGKYRIYKETLAGLTGSEEKKGEFLREYDISWYYVAVLHDNLVLIYLKSMVMSTFF
jgi:hypothetical protein